jgi:glycosyltransferase involved in cell wall biosynthesis
MNHVSNDLCKEDEVELIVGNSNAHFSGVTSTMLQVLPHQQKLIGVRVMGKHFLPDPTIAISFWQTAKICRRPLKNGKWRIFHARRVDEMIQGVLLKYIFKAKLKLVFSSAAQRKRSGLTLWLTRKMDAVVAVSERSAAFLVDSPAMVNPHGVQADDYHPAPNKQQAWQSFNYGGQIGIGILGRVRKQKGVHLFVNACIELLNKYPQVNAVVVGAISSSNKVFVQELQTKIDNADLSERIIFTGELPFEKIPEIFSALSLVAALSENEGFGLTVLEGMSSGAAVLATQAGAWEEIIRPGIDGYIVPVNDQKAVTEKLQLMLSEPENLTKMGQAGRERIEQHYQVEDEAEHLVTLFRQLQGVPS